MYSTIIILAISGATALSVQSPSSHSLARLFSRQRSGPIDPSTIPKQCQSPCNPIVTDLQGCTSDQCLCTDTVRNDFASCINCFVSTSAGNPTITSAAQAAASQYAAACQAAGSPVAPLPVSGANSASPPAVSVTTPLPPPGVSALPPATLTSPAASGGGVGAGPQTAGASPTGGLGGALPGAAAGRASLQWGLSVAATMLGTAIVFL